MSHYGKNSRAKLVLADQKLQLIFLKAILVMDIIILCAHRDEEEQNKAYKEGKSKQVFGGSKHNRLPSQAIDASPWPIPDNWGADNFKELAKFYMLAGIIKGIASEECIPIRWGGDWNSDNDFKDNNFDDLVHYELI